MKNLVIHPEDASTFFLKPIYEKVENKTVVDKGSSPQKVEGLIKNSDRVMMMGHGNPNGLFSIKCFAGAFNPYIIGKDDVDTLRKQAQNVYVWCHANRFVEENDLHGFYSGMFISEVGEANFCGVRDANQEMVNESNRVFSEIVGEGINLPKEELYEKVITEYGELAKTNPVAAYNLKRLFVR